MVQTSRLLTDDGTLYGMRPSEIAEMVKDALRELAEKGFEVVDVEALPDYHNWGSDGGVKDIFFLYRGAETPQPTWHTRTIIADNESMHGESTQHIMRRLANAIEHIQREKSGVVMDVIMLTDHHQSPIFQGAGGRDGVKNIIICYQEPTVE